MPEPANDNCPVLGPIIAQCERISTMLDRLGCPPLVRTKS